MNADRTMLVHDALRFLRRRVEDGATGNELLALVGRRLGWPVGNEASLEAAITAAAAVRGGERSSHHVALLGFACLDGSHRAQYGAAFGKHLEWVVGRPNFAATGEPCSALSDPVIFLGIWNGANAVVTDPAVRVRVAGWLKQLAADFARLPPSAEWSRFYLEALLLRSQGGNWQPNEATPGWLPGALAAQDLALADERTAGKVLTSAAAGAEAVADDFEAALRLAAMEWSMGRLLNESPEAMTAAGVAGILANVTRVFQRWTWEAKPRTKGAQPRQWHIENEYHVQSLLYIVLKPFLANLEEEKYLPATGVYQPRADLSLLSLQLVIEVKYWYRGGKVRKLIEEIAADAALYLRPDSPYRSMIAVIWDEAARTEEHDELRRGLSGLAGVQCVVIIPRPSVMADAAGS